MSDLADLDATDAGDGLVVARIRGDLDLSNLYSVHTALLEVLPNEGDRPRRGPRRGDVPRQLGGRGPVPLQTSLGVRQQRFAVAIPPGATIRRALELSGVQGEMTLCGSVDEALDATCWAGARRAGDPLSRGYDWVCAHCASARSPSGMRGGRRDLGRVAQVPLGVERRLAARAGGGDRLAVGVVDEVAGGEDARQSVRVDCPR